MSDGPDPAALLELFERARGVLRQSGDPPKSAAAGEQGGGGDGGTPPPSGAPSPEEDRSAEEAALFGEIEILLDQRGEAQNRKSLRERLAGLDSLFEDALDDAIDLLEKRRQVAYGDDGSPLLKIGEETVALDEKNIRRALRPRFFRPKGAPGSGEPPPQPGRARSRLDMSKARDDQRHYEEHHREVKEALRRRAGGGNDGK